MSTTNNKPNTDDKQSTEEWKDFVPSVFWGFVEDLVGTTDETKTPNHNKENEK